MLHVLNQTVGHVEGGTRDTRQSEAEARTRQPVAISQHVAGVLDLATRREQTQRP